MDGLIRKAGEELRVSDAEGEEVNYAGMCVSGNDALLWFFSGNEHQEHVYLAMECQVMGEDQYVFVRIYQPLERGKDLCVVEWKDGYSYCVNNPLCKKIKITDGAEDYEIPIEERIPCVLYEERIPDEYVFLDEEGKTLK